MKKFLVVLLALAMVFAVATTAMAADKQIPDYSDTTTSTAYANDIYRLTALGVLQGNTGWGGAYRPNDNLTRAEFAKIACYMFGKQAYVEYYAARKTAFSDVTEGDWSEGWINCAYDNGLMIGVGNGKFNPNANVTKQEVATVVLRAVGYTDELPGPWPSDYIAKSQKVIAPFANKSLFDYVEKIDGTAASRGVTAAIVNYALDLYRVEHVGSQLMVQGVSTADADGYTYKALKTNEADFYNFFLGLEVTEGKITLGQGPVEFTLTFDPNITARETLLWDVFHAFETPYLFQFWAADAEGVPNQERFVEASGWGYADFDQGELVFKDEPISRLAGDANDLRSVVLPVASDYYIFDDCLDGELWNLGGRLASLTIQVDVDKANIRKIMSGNLTGLEAVYAQMLTDVAYVDKETEIKYYTGDKVKVDNADVFSFDLGGFAGANLNDVEYEYDYDWFRDEPMGIVKSVSDDMVTVNYTAFGENGGEFCLLDKCKVHTLQNYTFLKDGKLQDASCLKLNDVVYFAGDLASPVDARPIKLYVVFTPKAGTFDQLVNGAQAFNHYGINLSGVDYLYCPTEKLAHQVSYDGGYTEGDYKEMRYTELRAKLTDKDFDGSCLYTVGYGKKYVASLIFAAKEINRGYGVISDFTPNLQYPDLHQFYATALDFFGPDGKNTGELKLDTAYGIGAEWLAYGENFLGWLDNYYLDKDGQVILTELGDVYKAGKDVGYVSFSPGWTYKVTINGNGRFENAATLDTTVSTSVNPKKQSFQGMAITADTVIFEVSTKLQLGGYGPPRVVFDSVKLGDASKYIDSEFTAQQMDIFAWSDNKVDVLYVVNPHFNGEVLMGLFDVSRIDAGGYFFTFEDGTELRYSNDFLWAPADGELFYGIYRTKDGEVNVVRCDPNLNNSYTYNGINAGDLVILFKDDGPAIDPDFVEAALLDKDNVSGAASVKGLDMTMDYDDISVNDLLSSTEYIDMTGDGDFDYDFFATGHGDAYKYRYVTVRNAGTEILKVFRFAE